MKQIVQSFKTGKLSVVDVPPPSLRPEGVLVRTAASLVSAGTERMLVEFAEKNLVQKARARPDLVRQVVDKAQREGVLTTVDSVRNRLDQPLPLGYSTAGIVVEVGREAGVFQVGERVACAGGGYASHAEMTYVPRTLAVKLPPEVAFESASFTTLGAIALQGIRQADVVLGHKVAVIGLGLLGQLTVQLLKAAGCNVFGVDIDPQRVQLALESGADAASGTDTALSDGQTFTLSRGFDAILITADTKSNDPVVLAGELARDRAIVVAVGAVGLEIPRKVYYEKELDLRLSRSYGPGRYDSEYEDKGHDYPYGYVRWTEQRNMEAFVQLLSSGAIDVAPLITHRFPIDDAVMAYDIVVGKTSEPSMGVVLTYSAEHELIDRISLRRESVAPKLRSTPKEGNPGQPAVRIGMLGAGNFVNATLLPAMQKLDELELVGIVSGAGVSARSSGDRFGFAYCASDESSLLADDRINWVVVATRHNFHAGQAINAMRGGKSVFVEKPLALNREELNEVVRVQQETGMQFIVGFNRRFAPLVQEMRRFINSRQRPLVANYRINAGSIPNSHWTQDSAVGGRRIIGEACHFIDLLQFLIGATCTSVFAMPIRTVEGVVDDELIIAMNFSDGSVGTVTYTAGGDKAFGKERIELLGDGRVAVLDDYRSLQCIVNGKRSRSHSRLRPEKGHRQEWEAIVGAVCRGLPLPISIDEIISSHLATFAAVESVQTDSRIIVESSLGDTY